MLWSATLPSAPAPGIFSLASIARSAAYWNDPVFVTFFLYFLVTIFGGISIVLVTRGDAILKTVREEPEWLTFAVPIVLAAALGDADIWRYLAYTLPAAVTVYAACAAEWSLRRLIAVSAFGLALTLVLQDPFKEMTVPEYFRRWFPYYLAAGKVPVPERLPLFPLWARFGAAVGIGLVVMPLLARPPAVRRNREAG